MNHQPIKNSNLTPNIKIEHLREELAYNDLQDLCDATDSAMPQRHLFVARHDDIICGTCQLIKQPMNNEAQSHIMQLNTHFVAPWARGYGLARMLLQRAEKQALKEGASVINLDVRETQDMAIALYESEGYDQCGTHPAYAYVDGSFIQGRYYMKLLENDRQ
jgi:ribosomal protein S18 acetylase RimI-like enzyme